MLTVFTNISQEVLRFHPIVYHLVRYATRDDVIPLSEPITTVTGEVIYEIPVSKGQIVQPSFCTYNRLVALHLMPDFVV